MTEETSTLERTDELKTRIKRLTELLAETTDSIKAAIGVELEYGDYSAAERLRDLKGRIEKEIKE